jgi:death-on-curing protein
LALHDEQLAEHGGAQGLRDDNLLESALAKPRNLFAYGEPDFFELAASYAAGLVRNHPFVDGNKRTSFVLAALFLTLNGFEFSAPEAEVPPIWLSFAAGELDEAEIASWLRSRTLL